MRLRPQDVIALRTAIYALAPDARAIRLFGSRLDDNARGGDVDLMIDFEKPIDNPAVLSASLAVEPHGQCLIVKSIYCCVRQT